MDYIAPSAAIIYVDGGEAQLSAKGGLKYEFDGKKKKKPLVLYSGKWGPAGERGRPFL